MAGLTKLEEYDWKDSNVALIGSNEDRKFKKDSAEVELAWKHVGKATQPSLYVWRIKKFNLVEVCNADVGSFYNGDSYIVCKISKVGDALKYDIHFWIGKKSTQDEYVTAAYKTVELDTYLDDRAIQHREVEGYESDLFKSYFDKLVILEGGFESGFRYVKPQEYKPRLLRFHKEGQKKALMREVQLSKESVTSDDVFILDTGSCAFQFNGKKSSPFEKNEAGRFLQDLRNKRNGRCKTEVLDEEFMDKSHEFWKSLPDEPLQPTLKDKEVTKALYRLSDESGKMTFDLVCEGTFPKSDITNSDVYMIDTNEALFVYIGSGCSQREKKKAFYYAHKHLVQISHPYLRVIIVSEDQGETLPNSLWD